MTSYTARVFGPSLYSELLAMTKPFIAPDFDQEACRLQVVGVAELDSPDQGVFGVAELDNPDRVAFGVVQAHYLDQDN